jgi:lycopene beta-cyclase
VLIVGAGCSGLSLAVALVDAGLRSRIVLVDPRRDFGADRTWCFFDDGRARHRFADCVTHAWTRWEVRSPDQTVVRSADGLRYCHVPSERFYATALAALGDRVELVLGESVEDLRDEGGTVTARTSRGTVLRARRAFDSRPQPRASLTGDHTRLLQSFVGQVVEAEHDVFDPGLATLMDFSVMQDDGIHFAYVLPFDARRALVESTFFAPQPRPRPTYERAIDGFLRDRHGLERWRVVAREDGAIPMTSEPFPLKASPRVYRIGIAGGLAKPSTGFAFLAIQRFSRELARRLVARELPEPPAPRPARTQVLDTVFLSYLARHPERAPATFTRLFARVEPHVLVRFLGDTGSAADDLRVMSALGDPGLVLETARSRRAWAPALFAR